jgi:hypothetical protein
MSGTPVARLVVTLFFELLFMRDQLRESAGGNDRLSGRPDNWRQVDLCQAHALADMIEA